MKEILKEKLHEAVWSVVPPAATVVILDLLLLLTTGNAMPWGMFFQFVIGSAFVLAGVCFLALGEDLALVYMGDRIGAHLASTKKYVLLIVCSFLIGGLVTIAEPNLTVFASLLPGIADRTVIFAAALGVGFFMVFGVLRVIKRVPLPAALTAIYILVFALAYFAPRSSFSLAFDAGGIATGPVTAAFIMSVGIGLAAVRGGKSSVDSSFGTLAFCTIGPIAAMLLLGLFGVSGEVVLTKTSYHAAHGAEVITEFLHELPIILEEVALALAPMVLLFLIFNFVFLKLTAPRLLRTGVGVVYAFLGHTLFLTGIYVGFLPAGGFLGETIANLPDGLNMLLIPTGMLMGGLALQAEPAVHVLVERVEDITVGAVTKKAMLIMLTVGVVLAVGLSMLRILTGVSLWYFIVIGYAVSLTLSFFVPNMFTSIAFDSGGVAAGAMTVAFLLPFAKGACGAIADDPQDMLTDAFGLVALIVIMPIITIQVLGLVYKIELKKVTFSPLSGDDTVTIVEFDGE